MKNNPGFGVLKGLCECECVLTLSTVVKAELRSFFFCLYCQQEWRMMPKKDNDDDDTEAMVSKGMSKDG